MVDVHTAAVRSKNMAAIKNKNTKPELIIRKLIHGAGYRYSLHSKALPGKPDIVLKKYKAIINVNGCFWHAHDCHLFKLPRTRTSFWQEKISGNTRNDERHTKQLRSKGWKISTVWECAIKGKTQLVPDQILQTLEAWLRSREQVIEISGK